MDTVSDFITRIGRDRFTKETGFLPQVISRAISENIMPAGWFPAVRDLCNASGEPVPEHLFRWTSRQKEAGAA